MACVVLAMYRPQGSVNKQLEYMGNSGYYNDVFGFMLPFGALFVPFTGPLFHKLGMVKSIWYGHWWVRRGAASARRHR